jgi:Periplasmic glycine betaine/choline-binding (lipo)protein of an ABC-type transport system (osmoprotectant binding protein)
MTEKLLTEHPELRTTLNKLAGRVSTTDMRKMNYLVTVKHHKAATVAREYLQKQGLLKAGTRRLKRTVR